MLSFGLESGEIIDVFLTKEQSEELLKDLGEVLSLNSIGMEQR